MIVTTDHAEKNLAMTTPAEAAEHIALAEAA